MTRKKGNGGEKRGKKMKRRILISRNDDDDDDDVDVDRHVSLRQIQRRILQRASKSFVESFPIPRLRHTIGVEGKADVGSS